jgi:hypothetical protein
MLDISPLLDVGLVQIFSAKMLGPVYISTLLVYVFRGGGLSPLMLRDIKEK